MEITASLVKELREKTGVGMMDCKKALNHSEGDFEKAIVYLREKGLAAISKKSDRDTKEGNIFIATDSAGQKAVILEVNCETDFVATNTDFAQFGNTLAQSALTQGISSAEALTGSVINGKNYSELLSEAILKLGENITLKQLNTISAAQIASYVHMNGKIGVVVGFAKAIDAELGRDIAMHIAASAPQYLNQSQVPAEELEKEKDIIRNQAINEGKPAEIAEKMVAGRIQKFYKDICLLDQAFVKDNEQTVAKVVGQSEITGFYRYAF